MTPIANERRKCHQLVMAAIASLLLATGLSSVQPAEQAFPSGIQTPTYTVHLDIAAPEHVRLAMRVPSEQGIVAVPPTSRPMRASPACGRVPLAVVSAGMWVKPAGCEEVLWAATVPRFDGRIFDTSRPASFWNARRLLWLLSGDLPWLRYERQSWAPVHVIAKSRNGIVANDVSLPGTLDSPVYILIGQAKRYYRVGAVTTAIYGDIPIRPQYERLQHIVAATLARWRRDLLPNDAAKRDRFNYLWLEENNGAEPGFFASTGSDAILMQFVPDLKEHYPYAKLDAGILLTGIHEGFHELAGVLSEGKPTWVNESWASYFAYATARHILTGPALATARQFFEGPADISVLHAQALFNTGDGSRYEVFYTKAGRFWAAIDSVLTNRPNDSGRLAALLKQTRGMQGVNWSDPASIAAFLDPRTAGRAKGIVQCYLVEDRCLKSDFSHHS